MLAVNGDVPQFAGAYRAAAGLRDCFQPLRNLVRHNPGVPAKASASQFRAKLQ
jgi:hypothetical protein